MADSNCAIYIFFNELFDHKDKLCSSVDKSRGGFTVRILGSIVSYSGSRDLLELSSPHVNCINNINKAPEILMVDTSLLDKSARSELVSVGSSLASTGFFEGIAQKKSTKYIQVIGELTYASSNNGAKTVDFLRNWLLKAQSCRIIQDVQLDLYYKAANITRQMLPQWRQQQLPNSSYNEK